MIWYPLFAGVIQSSFISALGNAVPVKPVTWSGTSDAIALAMLDAIPVPYAFIPDTL